MKWWSADRPFGRFVGVCVDVAADGDPYAAWAESYPPVAHNALMRVEEAAVTALLPDVAGFTVLDAGCGTGRYARVLTSRGAARVIAVDASIAMLCRAEGSAWRLRADVRALPIGNGICDVIVSGLAVLDVPDLEPVVTEWSRVLRCGGVAICSTLHPRGAVLGWTRTFAASGGTRRLPAFWHSLGDFVAACTGTQLAIDAAVESGLPSMRGSSANIADNGPVALIVRARRR